MQKVIFACVHNGGRSQMATAFFNEFADRSKAKTVSAGTQPGERLHPEVFAVMQEIDQRGGGCKAQTSALTAGSDSEAGGEMALTGAGISDQQHRLRAVEILAFGESADAGRRDVRRLREVELFKRLDPGQVSLLDAQFDGPLSAVLDLGLKQGFEVVHM